MRDPTIGELIFHRNDRVYGLIVNIGRRESRWTSLEETVITIQWLDDESCSHESADGFKNWMESGTIKYVENKEI